MRRFTLLICIYFIINGLLASDILVLSEKNSHGLSITNNYFDVLEDTSSKLTIDDIVKSNNFKQVSYNYNVHSNSAYWLRLEIKNEGNAFTQYVIENYYLHAKDFSIYYVENEKVFKQSTGEYVTYNHRDYRHKNLVLDLPVPDSNKIRTYYIRVFSPLYVNFNFVLKSQHYFTQYSNAEYLLLGIYYGIILLLILYNIILFFTLKSRIYILYIFYLLSGILISLNEDKLGYQYLWPEYPFLNPLLSFHVAPLLLEFCFLIYASDFLEIRKRNFRLFLMVWFSFAAYVITFALNFYFPLLIVMRIVTPLPFLCIFVSAIILFLNGNKSARFFILGSGLIVTSVILIQLRALAIIMGSIFTVYIFNYSLIIESIILSIALSDKIKIIRTEKEFAQKTILNELREKEILQNEINTQLKEKHELQGKINQELEIKVTERTKELNNRSQELEVVNAKLQSLIDQTNSMNIKLDLDNWELKKNVRHELVQRITGQEVSMDMFKTVFKDDITCLRFLDELKWSKGYVCKKCGYTKFKEPDHSFVRKCSKCSHPESVTSSTLLHGMKFAICDALYLVYLVHARRGNIRLEEVSEIAGISIVSASKFRAKIMEKITLLEKKHKNVTWEEIILN